MTRITDAILERLVDAINGELGKTYPEVGSFTLDHGYGRVKISRVHDEWGALTEPISMGYVGKRDCYDIGHAFLAGLRYRREQ